MRAIAALLALAVALPAAASPPPAVIEGPGSLIVQVQQRAPRGGGAGNPGANDHTAATSDVYSFQPVQPPAHQSPVTPGGDGRGGQTQYACMSTNNGMALYSDGLGNQNYGGGSCTFYSSENKTAGCPEGCGSYTYNDLYAVSMPGGGTSYAGQKVVDRSGCYAPTAYNYACDCHYDSCGNYVCPTTCTAYSCGYPQSSYGGGADCVPPPVDTGGDGGGNSGGDGGGNSGGDPPSGGNYDLGG